MSFMTSVLVRSVCDKMSALKLKSIPRENVGDLDDDDACAEGDGYCVLYSA